MPATSPRDVTPAATISLIWVRPGLLADRRRARPAQLDAVVLRGVVARGEHRAGRVELAGREVDDVGGAQADVGHVGAGERRALDERGRERLRRRPHVVADDHLLRAGEVRERVADPARERLVDLFGIQPAHVVSLEDGVERHDGLLQRTAPKERPRSGAHGSGRVRRRPAGGGPPAPPRAGARRARAPSPGSVARTPRVVTVAVAGSPLAVVVRGPSVAP